MDLLLRDKVAIVTGASRGIGRAIALAAHAGGFKTRSCNLAETVRVLSAAADRQKHRNSHDERRQTLVRPAEGGARQGTERLFVVASHRRDHTRMRICPTSVTP
jgi:NAD(P)-dependent dehydrogenase (short-subunit alcohol dehydrogenase family)